MKILIIGLNFAPELIGVGKYTGDFAAWLEEQGHEVRVITAPPYYPAWTVSKGYRTFWYEWEKWRGIKTLRCPLWVPRHPSALTRILHLASFAVTSFLPSLWQGLRWRPDVVWTTEPTAFSEPTALLTARISGAAAFLHIQDLEVEAALSLQMLSRSWMIQAVTGIYGNLLRRFDMVSTISTQMRDQLTRYGIEPERQALFPNWVDTLTIRPLDGPSELRAELGIAADKVVALYAGNMGEKQGVEGLAAMARLLKDDPSIHIVMAGEGSRRDQIAAMTADLDHVTLLPLQPMDRFNRLMNLADIHLLPQRPFAGNFALPSKFGGMLASGRPVVVQAEGGELAEAAAMCGLVVEPGDIQGLAHAVRTLAKDGDRREQLGLAARAYAEAHLARDAVLGRFHRVLADGKESKRKGWLARLLASMPSLASPAPDRRR